MSDVVTLPSTHLELPARLDLGLFVYGLLQPGQPAYDSVLGSLGVGSSAATMERGALRLRDGLPILDPDGQGGVAGHMLTFPGGQGREFYEAVCRFEPRQHYRWLIAEIRPEGGTSVTANVLQGRHPERGSVDEWFRSWRAAEDPHLRYGLHHVRRMALDSAREPVGSIGADNPALWTRFFGLQACYLMLWSALDRYSAMAVSPAEEPLTRAHTLGTDPGFRARVIEAGVPARAKVADSRDPGRWRRIREDGSGAMYAWEAVRTTLGHPGRTAWADAALLRRSIVELHDTFRLELLARLPELAAPWTDLDPNGADHRWLLRPVVDPEGLA